MSAKPIGTIYVALARCEPNLGCEPVNLKVETTGDLPDFGMVADGWSEKSLAFHENQALSLVDALSKTLPGGTLVAMLRLLLLGHAAHWRVPLADLPRIPQDQWVDADHMALLSAEDCDGHWWWWDGDGATLPVYLCPSWPAGKEAPHEVIAPGNQHGWNREQGVQELGGWFLPAPEPEIPQHIQRAAETREDIVNDDFPKRPEPIDSIAAQHLADVITSIKVAVDKSEISADDSDGAGALIRQLERILSTVPPDLDFSVTFGDIATAVRRERELRSKMVAPYSGEANELEDAQRALDALISDIPTKKWPVWVVAELLPPGKARVGNWWLAREGRPTTNVYFKMPEYGQDDPNTRAIMVLDGIEMEVEEIPGAMFLPNRTPDEPVVLATPAPDDGPPATDQTPIEQLLANSDAILVMPPEERCPECPPQGCGGARPCEDTTEVRQ